MSILTCLCVLMCLIYLLRSLVVKLFLKLSNNKHIVEVVASLWLCCIVRSFTMTVFVLNVLLPRCCLLCAVSADFLLICSFCRYSCLHWLLFIPVYWCIHCVSEKRAQLWNGIARNYMDRFWWYLAEIFKSL